MRWLGLLLAGVVLVLAGVGRPGLGQGEGTAAGPTVASRWWPPRTSGARSRRSSAATRVQVRSIIVNPATDPHSYEPTAADARTMAGARLAIVNGVGYDEWASKLLAASPLSGRVTLDVGHLLGLQDGDNPHRWYFPADVYAVVRQIADDYEHLDPGAKGYFAQRRGPSKRRASPATTSCAARSANATPGMPVGYSESIFQGLGENLGLKLLTPYSFAKAIAEGSEVTAQDKRTVDSQAEAPHRSRCGSSTARTSPPTCSA